mgnify:CR=1 FL=1
MSTGEFITGDLLLMSGSGYPDRYVRIANNRANFYAIEGYEGRLVKKTDFDNFKDGISSKQEEVDSSIEFINEAIANVENTSATREELNRVIDDYATKEELEYKINNVKVDKNTISAIVKDFNFVSKEELKEVVETANGGSNTFEIPSLEVSNTNSYVNFINEKIYNLYDYQMNLIENPILNDRNCINKLFDSQEERLLISVEDNTYFLFWLGRVNGKASCQIIYSREVRDNKALKIGDTILFADVNIPDRWYSSIDGTSRMTFYPLETRKSEIEADVKDVQVNGESVLDDDGVANVTIPTLLSELCSSR